MEKSARLRPVRPFPTPTPLVNAIQPFGNRRSRRPNLHKLLDGPLSPPDKTSHSKLGRRRNPPCPAAGVRSHRRTSYTVHLSLDVPPSRMPADEPGIHLPQQ